MAVRRLSSLGHMCNLLVMRLFFRSRVPIICGSWRQ
jgi:hypothetical protein